MLDGSPGISIGKFTELTHPKSILPTDGERQRGKEIKVTFEHDKDSTMTDTI